MNRAPKTIPEHITIVSDAFFATKYKLFNTRLQEFVGEDPDFKNPIFNTPAEARAWYLEQI